MRASDDRLMVDPIASVVAEVVGEWPEISAAPGGLEGFRRALTAMANDLGLSPAEFRALAAKGAATRQLAQMMEALRIETHKVAEAAPATLGHMRRLCRACVRKTDCDGDIAAKTVAAPPPAYCPNGTALRKLQSQDRFTSAA